MNPAIEFGWNLVLAAAEVFFLVRARGAGLAPVRVAARLALPWLVAMAFTLPIAREGFAAMRLWAWGIFAHAPLLCVAMARVSARRSRCASAAFAIAATALLAIATDAFLIEPRRLEVEHVRLKSAKLKAPLRIAVLTDIQTDNVGEHERRAVRAAMKEKPEIVLLCGDYIEEEDDDKRRTQHESLRRLFLEESLTAPLGVYAVEGDNDWGDWLDIFAGLPVHTSKRTFDVQTGEVAIRGLSLADSRRTDLAAASSPSFQIVFGHAPDFALSNVPADLLVAGHTHGGQVQIPGFGPPITLTSIPRRWAAGGATDIGGGRTLVVSRGIGMERGSAPRLRFWCPPHVVIIDVVPAAD
ncbi:MAG: metallophosphoesterase [Planctomycetota bacterium]